MNGPDYQLVLRTQVKLQKISHLRARSILSHVRWVSLLIQNSLWHLIVCSLLNSFFWKSTKQPWSYRHFGLFQTQASGNFSEVAVKTLFATDIPDIVAHESRDLLYGALDKSKYHGGAAIV